MTPLPPQKKRELLLVMLYARTATQPDQKALIDLIKEQLKVEGKEVEKAWYAVDPLLSQLSTIDERLEAASEAYQFERILDVEKNILRLATWELDQGTLPVAVIIAEALRLTQKFASPSAVSFVHALLDLLVKQRTTP